MKYFNSQIKENLKLIYYHRFFATIANTFFGSFGIIFLYKIFDSSLFNLAVFFAFTSFGYIVFLPWLKLIVNKIGLSRTIFWGWIINLISLLIYYF